jgi:hypothetical protein
MIPNSKINADINIQCSMLSTAKLHGQSAGPAAGPTNVGTWVSDQLKAILSRLASENGCRFHVRLSLVAGHIHMLPDSLSTLDWVEGADGGAPGDPAAPGVLVVDAGLQAIDVEGRRSAGRRGDGPVVAGQVEDELACLALGFLWAQLEVDDSVDLLGRVVEHVSAFGVTAESGRVLGLPEALKARLDGCRCGAGLYPGRIAGDQCWCGVPWSWGGEGRTGENDERSDERGLHCRLFGS